MYRKRMLLIFMFILAIGFASLTTNLVLSGTTNISANSDDFNVYFSKASISSSGSIDGVNTQILTFNTGTLSLVGETSVIDYSIYNNSTEYDANVIISCTGTDSEYYSVESTLDGNIITGTNTTLSLASQREKSGTITITLIKAYAGDENISDTFTCTLTTSAVSRDEATIASIQGVKLDINAGGESFCSVCGDDYNGQYFNMVYFNVTNNTSETLENFKIVLKFKSTLSVLKELNYYGNGIGKWNQDTLTYTIYAYSPNVENDDGTHPTLTIAAGESMSFGSMQLSFTSDTELDFMDYFDYIVVAEDYTELDSYTSDGRCSGSNSELNCIVGYSEE